MYLDPHGSTPSDPYCVCAGRSNNGHDRLGRFLGSGLVLGRGGDEVLRRIVEVEVVIARRIRPVVPRHVQDHLRTARSVKGECLIVPGVAVAVGEGPFPVALCLVPRSVYPDDPSGDRPLGDLGDRPCSVGEVCVEPAEGVVDDIDSVVQCVGDRKVEVDLIGDLNQVKLRPGRDLVHDLRNSGPVSNPASKTGPGEVVFVYVAGEISPCLRLGEAGKAEVDDRYPDSASGNPGGMKCSRSDRSHPLPGDTQGMRSVRRADERDSPDSGGDSCKL